MSYLRSKEDAGADDELEDILEGLERIDKAVSHGRILHVLNVVFEYHHQLTERYNNLELEGI